MKRDPFESAIDEILASADGDVRRALRAVLVENIALESELRSLYAASEHGRLTDTKNSCISGRYPPRFEKQHIPNMPSNRTSEVSPEAGTSCALARRVLQYLTSRAAAPIDARSDEAWAAAYTTRASARAVSIWAMP